MDENLKFGKVLYAIRIARMMSLREFGSRLGLSFVYITDLENNRRKVTKAVLDALKENIDLLPDELEACEKAYNHDRVTIPADILYYIIDNDLIGVLDTYREKDPNGDILRSSAAALKLEQKKTMIKKQS